MYIHNTLIRTQSTTCILMQTLTRIYIHWPVYSHTHAHTHTHTHTYIYIYISGRLYWRAIRRLRFQKLLHRYSFHWIAPLYL